MTVSHATQPCPLPSSDLPEPPDGPLHGFDLDLFFELFLARWENPRTRASYRDDLRAWLIWCTERRLHPIGGIRRAHVEMWMRWLADVRGNAPSTINHRVGTLSTMFELAIDDDLVTKNPCRLVRRPKPKPDPAKRNHLTLPELTRLLDAGRESSPTDHALLMLMAQTGLRVSEACALQVTDCFHYEKGHRCIRYVGKGGKVRIVPLPPVVQLAVDAAIDGRSSGPLLQRRDGTQMTRRSADRVVKRCAAAAGITAVTVHPHMLRATFIVQSINAGEDIRNVQLSAGHAQISTTVDCYDRCRVVLSAHSAYGLASYIEEAA